MYCKIIITICGFFRWSECAILMWPDSGGHGVRRKGSVTRLGNKYFFNLAGDVIACVGAIGVEFAVRKDLVSG